MIILYIGESRGPSCTGKDLFLVLPCLVDTHLTGLIKQVAFIRKSKEWEALYIIKGNNVLIFD